MDINIKYHRWNKRHRSILLKSCTDILNIKEIQFYQPYFSLYFHIHNTKKSHQVIDLQRRFILKEILEITNEKYHTSNIHINCKVYDTKKKYQFTKELFCKCIPLLDPLYYIMNNYNNFIQRNHLLPSCYNYNTYHKINNIHNTAYIDTFLSFICSEITSNNLNPSFPIFYGSFNGIKGGFNFDISDDYQSIKKEYWFHKNMIKNDIVMDMYVSSDSDSDDNSGGSDDNSGGSDDNSDSGSDDNSDSDSGSDDNSDSGSDSGSDSDSDDNSGGSDDNSDSGSDSDTNDYIIVLKDIPTQFLFIETLKGTLEDLLNPIDILNTELILSCIFQVSFALMYMQKHYMFTHNDLHINNIMYRGTDKTYLYYKFNNIYYKVPTFGYLFKIIDFGRSTFTFHNKVFFNDTFEKHGEAEGQYTEKDNYLNFKNDKKEIIHQNFHFDLCRLAITILDVCKFDQNENYHNKQSFVDFIYNMTLTENGNSLFNLEDNFNMYISISKYASNSLPKNIIQNIIFNQYRITKKKFPKKTYYSV